MPAELAPDADQGVAGEWTTVPDHQHVIPPTRHQYSEIHSEQSRTEDRKLEEAVDEDEAGGDFDVRKSRQFKIVEKTLIVGDDVETDEYNGHGDADGDSKPSISAFKRRKIDKPKNIRKK